MLEVFLSTRIAEFLQWDTESGGPTHDKKGESHTLVVIEYSMR